ncbi:MAG: biotin--[acetyl-CoA-carboxylase] ligase [Mangrovibacterium sp.]|nr:biotin--[acetyl-CoA-carboxylase] ligase [Mangrovibacterium sp.]
MIRHIGHTIISLPSTPSTNNYAISQATDNEAEEGVVFLAYEQTAGRGQISNRWESEAGKNLTFSIVLKPAFLDIHRQFMLSKAVCLGLVSFLSRYADGVKVKWPNDIYLGDRKISGILIENAVMSSVISQSVVGIGLNVNQTVFRSSAPNPVSLKMITGVDYDLGVLIKELLNEIDQLYLKLKQNCYRELSRAYRENLYRLGQWHPFRDQEHAYTGMIDGVNPIGQLRIREKDGPVHEYHFKEVEYL